MAVPIALVPLHDSDQFGPGRQRHLGGALQEVVVAHRVQHRALRIGEHHHALRGDDLLEQQLHHGGGVLVQAPVALARHGQVGAQQRGVVGPVDAAQPQRGTALVRAHDRIDVRRIRQRRGRGAAVAEVGSLHASILCASLEQAQRSFPVPTDIGLTRINAALCQLGTVDQ
jgi:hypothetical protein